MPHSLAKNDAVFEAVHEVVANAAPCHPLDPLSQLLFPLVVVLLGQLVVGDTEKVVRTQWGAGLAPRPNLSFPSSALFPLPFPTKAILSQRPVEGGGGDVLRASVEVAPAQGPFQAF